MLQSSSVTSHVWSAISAHISDATAACFEPCHTRTVSGGDSHAAYLLEGNTAQYFVKLRPNQGPHQLNHEAQGNNAIQNTNSIRCPAVICWGTVQDADSDYEYLVLEYVQFTKPRPGCWEQLADELARFHQCDQLTQYGWPNDNYIGVSPQVNTQHSCWATFFAESRIGAMLDRLEAKGFSLTDIHRFTDNVKHLLADHQPAPSLLHGDLWTGNIGFCNDGPVIFDPAVYVGDRETDIAMTHLFGSLPEAFYEQYYKHFTPGAGYQTRCKLYQLYHLLNHALIFGGHYLQTAKSAIIELQKEL